MARWATLDEIHNSLKVFANDEIRGPNGWTLEFFLDFFDLVGQ